jgi:hypothetical protein
MENSDRSQGWWERVQSEGTLWQGIAASTIDSLMAGFDYLHHGKMTTSPLRIQIPSGALYIRSASSKGDDSDNVCVGLPSGMTRRTLDLTQLEWNCLQAIERGENPEISMELAAKAVSAGLYACPE